LEEEEMKKGSNAVVLPDWYCLIMILGGMRRMCMIRMLDWLWRMGGLYEMRWILD
jgi:hypothetical protein